MWNENQSANIEAALARAGLKLKPSNIADINDIAWPNIRRTISGSSLDPTRNMDNTWLNAGWKESTDLSDNREHILKWDIFSIVRAEHQSLFAWKPDPNMSIEWTQDTWYTLLLDGIPNKLQITLNTTANQKEQLVRTILIQKSIAMLWDILSNPSIYDPEFTNNLNANYADLIHAKQYLKSIAWNDPNTIVPIIDENITKMKDVYRNTIVGFWNKYRDQWYDINIVTARDMRLLLWIQIENIKTWDFFTVRGPKIGEQPFASMSEARSIIAGDIAKNTK